MAEIVVWNATELITLLEIARFALKDASIFDHMANKLDMTDGEMLMLREMLNNYLGVDQDAEKD